ncbi:MAG: hypothetical protein J6W38_10890 [Prevotella sp.]|nr:hypothetical protein [Prevotella sp.]
MNIKSLFLTASVAVVGLVFVACSHDDFIDKDAPVKNLKAEYATNFEKKYGKIDPNQNWDFCSAQPVYSLPSSTNAARTRTGENSFDFAANTSKNTIVVEKDVLEWMYTHMPKGQDNKVKGEAFIMKVPNNSFTIAPIYQGYATYYWELWMSVDGAGDYKVWSKGEDFYYQDPDDAENEWTQLGNGQEGLTKDNGKFTHKAVKAPTYTFSNLPVGNTMSFYLKVWQNGSHKTGYQAYQNNLINPTQDQPITYYSTALNNCKMISLTKAQKPAAVPEGYDVTIIGCEDYTDNDFEDLVFMVYGNPVPPTERVEEVEEFYTKRYFMEDLGTTDDFDFNDVVVDVKYDRKKITIKYDNTTGEELSWTEENLPDVAIVRATGGTLDFTLTIGTTKWIKSENKTSTEMWNTGWNGAAIDWDAVLGEPFEVKGFNPETNNISVAVADRGNSGEVKTISFPKQGEAPMMLAVNPDVKWMKERVSIPTSWFTVPAESAEPTE